jgi:hypothetical protein
VFGVPAGIFRRAAALVCLGFVVVFGVQSPARAMTQSVVYPTGSYPADVQNVQAAVDRGGVVVLKATDVSGNPTAFNFGPPVLTGSGVDLTTNVSVQGESVKAYQTTIQGGFTPFRGVLPVKTRIADITFESPRMDAIEVLASTGTQIVGNRIDGVVGARVGDPTGLVFTFGDGIDLFGDNGSISGTVAIANNVIEDLTSDLSVGIQLDEISAVTTITNNSIDYPVVDGFVADDGIDALRVHTPLVMVSNSVHIGSGNPDAFPTGIGIAGDSDASFEVSHNIITSEHPNTAGIVAEGDVPGEFSSINGAVIANNRVSLASQIPFAAGVLLLGGVNDSQVVANRISGTGDFGLALSFLSPDNTADSNDFVNNDLALFTAGTADVFLDVNTANTTVVGQCRDSIDLGTDNTVACVKPIITGPRFTGARRLLGASVRRYVIGAQRG